MKATAIIAAGGSGSRFGNSTPKQFINILGIPLIIHTLRVFQATPSIDRIVIVLPKSDLGRIDSTIQKKFRLDKVAAVVPGGASRQASVLCGLEAISWPCEVVAIHDAARCLITSDLIQKTLQGCDGWDGAIAALPIRDTLKRVKNEQIEKTEPREELWGMQTPQAFKFPFILDAYQKAQADGFTATDDAQIAELKGGRVRVIDGNTQNIKITYSDDLKLAEILLRERESSL